MSPLKTLVAPALMAFVGLGLSLPALAQDPKFVPQGHSYAPGQERLPELNSSRDRVNSTTDVFEAELYQQQRERAILEGELDRLIQHDLEGGTNFQPRY